MASSCWSWSRFHELDQSCSRSCTESKWREVKSRVLVVACMGLETNHKQQKQHRVWGAVWPEDFSSKQFLKGSHNLSGLTYRCVASQFTVCQKPKPLAAGRLPTFWHEQALPANMTHVFSVATTVITLMSCPQQDTSTLAHQTRVQQAACKYGNRFKTS